MRLLRRLIAPGATRADWTYDAILTALAIALIEVPYVILAWLFGQIRNPATLVAAGLTGIAMMLPIVLRRHSPLLMMALMTLAAAAQVVTVPTPTASVVAVPFCAYTVARLVDGLIARSVVVVGAVGALVAPYRWIIGVFGTEPLAVLAAVLTALVCFGLVVTPYALGRRARDAAAARQAQIEAAAERHRIELSEHEQRALAAEETVRNRIARDLHDVVAHSISVMVVQAEGGRAAATKQPEVAAQALATIAETGRDALGEMRRLVAVLRHGVEGSDDYAPSPTLAELTEMTDRTGATVAVSGTRRDLPATVELTAYRIVQEALTNALKHAGPGAHPRVALAYDPDALRIEVVDSGTGPNRTGDGHGNGLRGMRERVSALGGTFEAGPGSAGGFVVRAALPLAGRTPGRGESTR